MTVGKYKEKLNYILIYYIYIYTVLRNIISKICEVFQYINSTEV